MPVFAVKNGRMANGIGDRVAVTSWPEIRARFVERVAQRGQSIAQVTRAAGISPDAPYRDRGGIPRLDTLDKLAASVDWRLQDLLGLDHEVDQILIKAAVIIVRRAFGKQSDDELARWLAIVINQLSKERDAGGQIDGVLIDRYSQTLIELKARGQSAGPESAAIPPDASQTPRPAAAPRGRRRSRKSEPPSE